MGDWQETAQMYEQIFSKPKMSEKLLSKPPFRYLHDVYTATMGKTGFGDGLFEGNDLNSKSFEDKESKLGFLVKLITLCEMVIGEKIDIKPSMVLAGQQADKTNLWLQHMFRAATSGVDTQPYIAQILGTGEAEGAEEDMQAQAEQQQQEEQARQEQEAREQAEIAAREKADKKKRHEEKKKRQKQADEDERQRQAAEEAEQERQMQLQQQREQEEMMQAQMMQQQQQQEYRNNVIRDDEVEEEEQQQNFRHHQEEVDTGGFEGKGGALVEEAKRMMQDDQEEAPQAQENSGPKIKMNRIGKKKRPAKAGDKAAPKGDSTATETWKAAGGPTGGFKAEDIEFMKKAIQVLCQSTNPLGKSIDFVTDDIDSMNKEFDHWRKESQACQRDLEEQQKITEEIIQPLQDQQAELEEKIREQQSKVNSTKSSIMRNDITVQNLLHSVISSRT